MRKPPPTVREPSPDTLTTGAVLSLRPWPAGKPAPAVSGAQTPGTRAYLLEVQDENLSEMVEAVLPTLGRLLREKSAQIRQRKIADLIDVMAEQMVAPSTVDRKMAQRLAVRRACLLNEFGFFTAEQLADANQSRASNRGAVADNWRKRGLVFAVRHRDKNGRPREVFLRFQFEDGRPIKVVQDIITAFGPQTSPWNLAMWFASNNGWLEDQARPVDLLPSTPQQVLAAARRDAAGSEA